MEWNEFHIKKLELPYEDVNSATNGSIVITLDFDNTNREYYGRSVTSIENKSFGILLVNILSACGKAG